MSLAISILVLVVISHILRWIGHTVVSDFGYLLYRRFSPRSSALYKAQLDLKAKLLSTRIELRQTSAQQEYAKWTRLRRLVDAGLRDLEKLNSTIVVDKTTFSGTFSFLIWLLTTGAQWWIIYWYNREAVFYLPAGWFGPIGWTLSLPFAPAGSVSSSAWHMACNRVITTGEKIAQELCLKQRPSSSPETSTATATATEPQNNTNNNNNKVKTS